MQIIGYETATEDQPARLLLAENGDIQTHALPPQDYISYPLANRHCAGTIEDGVKHHNCPNEEAPTCPIHEDLWQCALCRGDCTKPLASCEEPHAVYVAAFSPDIFKVGVTRSWRLETRLREQGAERAAHIRSVSDGRIARQQENKIAETLTDAVRVHTKIETLHKSVSEPAWKALLEEHSPIETFEFNYGFSLEQQPLQETILTGTVIGSQGRILLLSNNNTTYAVDLRDLLGFEINDEDQSNTDLQSSLTAF